MTSGIRADVTVVLEVKHSIVTNLTLENQSVFHHPLDSIPQGQPMRIVYRLRGLMGDATEDIIENLDNTNEEETDDEEVYKMATVMSECEGLEIMLHRLVIGGHFVFHLNWEMVRFPGNRIWIPPSHKCTHFCNDEELMKVVLARLG